MTLAASAFVFGAMVSLATSFVLVVRLERVGERLGLSEALLGIVAAFAANAPEITSSISALAQGNKSIGAGVVVGSNVFNLAALLGLGALVAGFIKLHRRVILLGGAVALWISLCCVAAVSGLAPVAACLVAAAAALGPYLAILGVHRSTLLRLPLPSRWRLWLAASVDEEEMELTDAIRPQRGRPVDAAVAATALIVVVVASIAMELGATSLGHHFHIADAVIGGLVLAAVTSLPNAVAAVHLAAQDRGAAALSTALNSNNLNVVVGLLIPGVILGIAGTSGLGVLTALWYLSLTAIALVLAYVASGLGRWAGGAIVAGYVGFVISLITATRGHALVIGLAAKFT